MSEKRADDEASFMRIADCFELSHENPGTKYCITSDSRFLRAFLCPGTLAKSFECCRPLVILDACHSRSRYGGIIISLCSPDGNGQIVPLAIGIAYVEDESSSSSFLSVLKQSIPAIFYCGISVVHDREKGLHNAQLNILPL
jgi:hypothetical protein